MRKVGIDGKEALFKASAAIPRIYRLKFQRDIYKDLQILEKSIGEGMRRLKKLRPTEREMTTPLFLLRCVQLGISMADMELLSIGLVNDMFVESRNDECRYAELGTQEDMDRF